MEDKSKLFVFDKKEVLLIFVFILVIASTAFTVGVRMGMKWQLENQGITKADIDTVKLKSQNEEYADKLLNEKANTEKDIKEEANKRLKEEIERAGKGTTNLEVKQEVKIKEETATEQTTDSKPDTGNLIDSYNITDDKTTAVEDTPKEAVEDINQQDGDVQLANNLKGKYTVQVGAYKTLDEAKSFASGFEVRGYSPIINEVKIPNKGTWYRVSVGAFGTRNEAKDYIVKEKSLFQSYDYLIKKID
jgi:cell division protein FtsN